MQIEAMQHASGRVVEEIIQINAVTVHAKERVTSIAAAVEEQTVTTQDMACRIGQASHVSQEIANDMATVNQTSTQIETASKSLKDQANALTTIATSLQEIVGEFRL